MQNETLYKQEILEHYKHPRQFGHLDVFTNSAQLVNASCGDEIEVTLKISKSGIIEDVMFTGSGCAISIASASILCELIKGKSVEQFSNLKAEDILKSMGMDNGSPRVKCALLGWEALRKAIK